MMRCFREAILKSIFHRTILSVLQNVIIDALFPARYFEIQFSSKNGTYHVVRTLQRGDTDIEGALSTIIKQVGDHCSDVPSTRGPDKEGCVARFPTISLIQPNPMMRELKIIVAYF